MSGPWAIRRGLWLWQARHLSPERLFILSFAGVILAGSLLLRLPWASAAARVGWVDAVFQSTSAVCVTGLATVDVGRDLSTAGQVVLILLFQIGGLGILTFSAAFFVILGHGLGSKERDVMQSTLLHAPRRDLAPVLNAPTVPDVVRVAKVLPSSYGVTPTVNGKTITVDGTAGEVILA